MLLYAGYRSGMLEILVELRDDNIMIILRPRDHKHRPSGECESVGTGSKLSSRRICLAYIKDDTVHPTSCPTLRVP